MKDWFRELRKTAWPLIAFLLGAANQLGGWTSPRLSYALFTLAVILISFQIWLRAEKLNPFARLRLQWPIVRRTGQPSFGERLYVGDIRVGLDKLQSEHWIEITVTGFNAHAHSVRVIEVTGYATFSYEEAPGNSLSLGSLPCPTLMPTVPRELAPGREFHICLQQVVSAPVAEAAVAALEKRMRVIFTFQSLNLQIAASTKRREVARLPLWDGLSVAKDSRLLSFSHVICVKTHEGLHPRADAA